VAGMVGDDDPGVLKQVLRALCDGSPDRLELEVRALFILCLPMRSTK